MCPFCQSSNFIRKGFYRKSGGKSHRIQRYLCKSCGRKFSDQTTDVSYRAKKPHFDQPLFRLLTFGVSQRAAADILGLHQTTVARKLVRLGLRAAKRLEVSTQRDDFGKTVVFDEMETFEHTKCKPLSIAVAVEEGSRRIIAAEVSSMPAKGRLAAVARKKYGFRPDHRSKGLAMLCEKVILANPGVETVKSDECPRYPGIVRSNLPNARHLTFKGRRGCVVGQGELKVGGFDPLFSLNHTCAMFRDNVKRLSRRTWCTTKRPDRLQDLLYLYAWRHNEKLRGVRRRAII